MRRGSQDRHRDLADRYYAQAMAAGGLVAFFDGCTEPVNPGGTGGYGAVVMRGGKRLFKRSGLVPAAPTNSNNVAEYLAVTAVLDWLLVNEPRSPATIFGDSRLVICQLWGWPPGKRKWKIVGVDHPDRPRGYYADAAVAAREKLTLLRHVRGYWIPREMNSLADELSKAELRRAGVEFRIQPEESDGEDAA